jgi:hypothetical protein
MRNCSSSASIDDSEAKEDEEEASESESESEADESEAETKVGKRSGPLSGSSPLMMSVSSEPESSTTRRTGGGGFRVGFRIDGLVDENVLWTGNVFATVREGRAEEDFLSIARRFPSMLGGTVRRILRDGVGREGRGDLQVQSPSQTGQMSLSSSSSSATVLGVEFDMGVVERLRERPGVVVHKKDIK